ncbi:hypothetical protein BKA69DRAFT_1121979 [Paraphysoderma sedebokerense]|nr:hypothetical protein BKA69DRAFT_1121979 [Paraphysoderma sedebokerense]
MSSSLQSSKASSVGNVNESSANPAARKRNKARDDTIRKKVEKELSRKSGSNASRRSQPQPAPSSSQPTSKNGTVASLRPSPPVTIRQSARVLEAAQLMAARRADALLIVDNQERLCGIVTDKDLAFRVVAEGLDPNVTKVFEIMTKNVTYVSADSSGVDALSKMTQGGFRHLPVLDEEGDVVGILDITKCLYDGLDRMEKAYSSAKKLTEALEDVSRNFGSNASDVPLKSLEALRQKIMCPDLKSVLSENAIRTPELGLKATVRDAARIMKELKSTAVLVYDDTRKLAGIFTTKDVVLRVLAVKSDPAVTSIIRVMTPHPDTVNDTTTVLDALKMMHTNHYLHLPVVHDDQSGASLVDVLKLTHYISGRLYSLPSPDGADGPMWNQFWSSSFQSQSSDRGDGDTTSSISDIPPPSTAPTQIRPSDSASVISDGPSFYSPSAIAGYSADELFVFKFRDPSSSNVVRLTSPVNLPSLITLMRDKLGPTVEINTLSYIDDDGDKVMLQSDEDLIEGVAMAKRAKWRRILLIVNDAVSSPQRRHMGLEAMTIDDTATELYGLGSGGGSPNGIGRRYNSDELLQRHRSPTPSSVDDILSGKVGNMSPRIESVSTEELVNSGNRVTSDSTSSQNKPKNPTVEVVSKNNDDKVTDGSKLGKGSKSIIQKLIEGDTEAWNHPVVLVGSGVGLTVGIMLLGRLIRG